MVQGIGKNVSIYRVKLLLSLQRGFYMSIVSAAANDPVFTATSPQLANRWARAVRAMLWVGLAVIGAWFIEAYFVPQDLNDTRPLHALAAVVSFFGRVFRFHLGVAACAIAGTAILLSARKLAMAAASLSLILLWPTFASFLPKSSPPVAGKTIRVMTINLMANNRYDAGIVYQIRQANPDVIAMEEYTDWADDVLPRELPEYRYRCIAPKTDATGMAVYSKLPISAEVQPIHNRLGTRIRLRATLQIDGRPVVFYAIHPSTPEHYINILRNRLQTLDLVNDIRNETDPVIVAGDFNATETTPNLHAYNRLGLQSAWDIAGVGRGSTWPDVTWLKHLPGVRIDHILIGRPLTCRYVRVCGPTGSDHRPVVADVGFCKAQ
jgi:endonuclease/exonuclease/phosphatase (EEP) superfamily protein YafD